MPETTPLIKAALNLRVGAGFDVYEISPQSYNNKIRAVTDFLVYLQRVQIMDSFPIHVDLFGKKVYSVVKRYPSLEEQLEYFSEYIYDFPKTLCVMSCILLYTGIDKENYFS